ncbi:MAG: hypothetical protein IJW23_11695, partial [Lentisphaeria bacterium]|nr:hypothetical protein [Lentisphaeria bacterium]
MIGNSAEKKTAKALEKKELESIVKKKALFPIQGGKSFCYFNFKMAFRFLHRKNRNAAKRFGKKGWSLRRGKR